jgi:hypothetical protein
MDVTNEIYIGDKTTFAIRYVPDYSNKDSSYYYAYCHLVLGGQIIGDKDESCFLKSWKHSLARLLDKIENNFDSISKAEFINKNDNELFDLIWKANQLSDCHVSIDETTDAYLIAMTENNGAIKFLWKGWREPCKADKIDKLFSVTVDRNFVIEALKKFLNRIGNET